MKSRASIIGQAVGAGMAAHCSVTLQSPIALTHALVSTDRSFGKVLFTNKSGDKEITVNEFQAGCAVISHSGVKFL